MANVIASQVQELYVGYLGRAADQAGLDFWTNAITAGTSTIESVALGFTLSQEYTSKYEGLSNEELAAAIYQNVLGRAADADGLAFWVGELEKGVQTPETLLAAMINSLGAVDQKVIDNKVYVANAYTAAAGADYKAEAGAKILEGVDGTAASVAKAIGTLPASTATLTEGLEDLTTAQAEVSAFVKAWGEANDVVDADATDITGAVAATAPAGITVIGKTNAQIAAAIAAEQADLDADLEAAQTAATASARAVSSVTGLKLAIDRYVDAFGSAAADAAAQVTANNALTGALNTFTLDDADVTLASARIADGTDVTNLGVKLGDLIVVDTVSTVETLLASYNGTKWTDVAGDEVTLTAAVQSAGVAFYNAAVKAETSLELVNTRLDVLDGIGAGAYVDAAGTDITTANLIASLGDAPAFSADSVLASGSIAETYAADAAAVVAAQTAIADFDTALVAYQTAAADAAELVNLQEAVTEARDVFETLGFNEVLLGTDDTDVSGGITGADIDVNATAGNDLYVLTDALGTTGLTKATIDNFGFLGQDSIYVGGYTLGTDVDAGNDSALEFFMEQVGANTVVTFETSAFGSNAATPELYTITLTGVVATDLAISNDFIQA